MMQMRSSVFIMMPILILACQALQRIMHMHTNKRLHQLSMKGLPHRLTCVTGDHSLEIILVLRENRQNAILIELGFLSNSAEERR